MGFSAVKDGGFVPVIPGFGAVGVDDIDPNIDTNFQLALKKMSKKDAVTKYKVCRYNLLILRVFIHTYAPITSRTARCLNGGKGGGYKFML